MSAPSSGGSAVAATLGTGGSPIGGSSAAGGVAGATGGNASSTIAGGTQNLGGTTSTIGTTSNGGTMTIGGSQSTGGTKATGGTTSTVCNGATPPTDIGTLSIAGDYVTTDVLHGYAYTWVGSSSIVPATCVVPSCTSSGCTPAFGSSSICAAGTVAADTSYNSVVGIGFNFNQDSSGSTAGTIAAPSSVTVTFTNPGGSPLRLQLSDQSTSQNWCIDTAHLQSGQAISITSFNTACWDNTGTYLSIGTPISSIYLVVPSDSSVSRRFSVCLTGVGVSGMSGSGGSSGIGGSSTSGGTVRTGGITATGGDTSAGGTQGLGGGSAALPTGSTDIKVAMRVLIDQVPGHICGPSFAVHEESRGRSNES